MKIYVIYFTLKENICISFDYTELEFILVDYVQAF